jgi:aspartate/tyrosine/aromatic aminotransferase
MKAAREAQINHKLNFQAIQAQRERHEFERVLKDQELKCEFEKSKKTLKEKDLKEHANLLRQQIKEREHDRINERKDFFQQAEEFDAKHSEHQKNLQAVIDRKLKELKEAGIDEKYIQEVTRQIQQPKRLTN